METPPMKVTLKEFTTLELAEELLLRLTAGEGLAYRQRDPAIEKAKRLLEQLQYRADYLEAKAEAKAKKQKGT